MATTLFGQGTETVDGTGTGNAGTIGLHFTVSSAQTLGGIWLYSPAGQSLTQLPTTIGLYNYSTQALIHSEPASWSGAAGSGWVFAAFTSPPALAASTDYMATAYRNDAVNGWFCFDSTYTWPASNPPITAPKDVGAGQGWFNNTSTASMVFPGGQDASFNWWLDVSVSASGSHTASAALTETPTVSAAPQHGHAAAGSVTVPWTLTAGRQHDATAGGALDVAAAGSAAPHQSVSHTAAGAVTIADVLAAAAQHGHAAAAAVGVSPQLAAAASKLSGQILISIAAKAGTDPFGNPYPQGIALYGPGGSMISLTDSFNGQYPQLGLQPPNAVHTTSVGQVFALAVNAGAANEAMFLVASSGKSGGDDAAIQFFSEAADASAPARAVLEFGGAVGHEFTLAGYTPSQAWTALTLQNGWANHGTANLPLSCRRVLTDEIEIMGIIDGSSATSAQFATLPAAPATQQPGCAVTSTAWAAGFVQSDTAGNLSIQASTFKAVWAVNGRIRLT